MKSELTREDKKQVMRVLKILARKPSEGLLYEKLDSQIRVRLGEKTHSFCADLLAIIETKKLITFSNTHLKITQIGIWYLKKMLNPDIHQSQLQHNLALVTTDINNQPQQVLQNTNESPLLRLFTRKTKTGGGYISSEEFQAGERLRKDFERGQLQPKISASLTGSIGSSGNSHVGGAADISDFAIDARTRLGHAIDTLGPELSGATLDICCFLKGLEIVERERRWPPRSAKLMLKTALSLLARHYGIVGYQNTNTSKAKSWGTFDYRPSI